MIRIIYFKVSKLSYTWRDLDTGQIAYRDFVRNEQPDAKLQVIQNILAWKFQNGLLGEPEKSSHF